MHVEATIESPIVFTGDQVTVRISFQKAANSKDIHILSAVTFIQAAIRLGDLILSEPFAALKASGLVVGRHGPEYNHNKSGGFLNGLWQLVQGQQSQDIENYPLFTTPQQLLFTDLALTSTHDFSAVFDLPPNAPPSYSSKSLAINYFVVIAFQTIRDKNPPIPSQLILPFKVAPCVGAPPCDLTKPIDHSPVIIVEESTKDRVKRLVDSLLGNKERIETPEPPSPLASAKLPTKVMYEFQRDAKVLGVLHLARPYFHIGETIIANMELIDASAFHLSVILELIETIDPAVAAANTSNRRVISSQFLTVWAFKDASIVLPTPSALSTGIESKQVSSSWSLRIELLCLKEPGFNVTDSELTSKETVDSELVTMQIPLTMIASDKGGHFATRLWEFGDF